MVGYVPADVLMDNDLHKGIPYTPMLVYIGDFSFSLLSMTINIDISHNPLLVTTLAPLKQLL